MIIVRVLYVLRSSGAAFRVLLASKCVTSLANGYRPEIDITLELNADGL